MALATDESSSKNDDAWTVPLDSPWGGAKILTHGVVAETYLSYQTRIERDRVALPSAVNPYRFVARFDLDGG